MDNLFEQLTTLTQINAGPVVIGERLVVSGILYAEARVSNYEWLEKESRWAIYLDWGQHGTSKVYSTDEGKVWTRWAQLN